MLFEYFPGNYLWNLSVTIALGTGGALSEVDEICRPLQEAARGPADAASEEFFWAFSRVAQRLTTQAFADLRAGHDVSAAAKYRRASIYYLTAERMQSRSFPGRGEAYRCGLDAFAAAMQYGRENCERVLVPYEGTGLPALYVRAETAPPSPSPAMVVCNGLDSTKEMVYGTGVARALAQRGIASLIVDHPGSGEALRLGGLAGYAASERWAGPSVDFLEALPEIDAARIGIVGWSLGGYYAPRAAAFEKRLKLCVAWGANFDWGARQLEHLAGEGDNPVPHYWEHVQWVFGAPTMESFLAVAPSVSLEPVIDRITVPLLVLHGEGDRQIPLASAHREYDGAINSPKRELRILTAEDGAVEHVGIDNLSVPVNFIADWVADTI